jgi:hypothetical protein
MNDLATSLIRTWTPMVVGAILSFLTVHGINLSDDAAKGLGTFLAALFAGLYYLAVRLWEKHYPKAGVLLGSATKPEYNQVDKG